MASSNKKTSEKSTPAKETVVRKSRTPIGGYTSQTDKYLMETVHRTQTMTFACVILCVFAIILGILNLFMKTGIGDNNPADAGAHWIECETENHVGYKVMSNWETEGYGNSVIFKPTESSAISISAQSVLEINALDEVEIKCTEDTLEEFVISQMSTAAAGQDIKNIVTSREKYKICDSEGIKLQMAQQTTYDGKAINTYTTGVFWIYEGYLYSLSYTTPVKGYSSSEFDYVVESVRIIPEEEWSIVDFDNIEGDVESAVEDMKEIADDITAKTEGDTTSNTTSE